MKAFLISLALAVIVIAGAAYFSLPAYSWHQKMTITVEADGKTYSGSSVVRVRFSKNDRLSAVNGPEWIATVRGEAPFVEIPGRGVLFALLNPPDRYYYATDLALKVFADDLPGGSITEQLKFLEADAGRSMVLSSNRYPFFVTFADINDPKSVRGVNPSNLAANFGPGARIESVTLQITKEPVSAGLLDEVLTWIDDPSVLKNPGWRNLPSLSQSTILRLKAPIGES